MYTSIKTYLVYQRLKETKNKMCVNCVHVRNLILCTHVCEYGCVRECVTTTGFKLSHPLKRMGTII